MADGTCKHEPCICGAAPDSDYCSDHCRDAVDQHLVEIKCDCGHGAC